MATRNETRRPLKPLLVSIDVLRIYAEKHGLDLGDLCRWARSHGFDVPVTAAIPRDRKLHLARLEALEEAAKELERLHREQRGSPLAHNYFLVAANRIRALMVKDAP